MGPARSGRGNGYALRPVGPRDLEALVLHRVRMWEDIGGRSRRAIAAHAPAYRRWLRRGLRSRRVAGFLAETSGGTPAASGLVWFQESQPRPGEEGLRSPYVLSMYTAPGHRGRGLASRILRAILGACRAKGYRRVTLHASEAGRSVYRRLGFVRGWEMRRFLGPAPARPRRSARRLR